MDLTKQDILLTKIILHDVWNMEIRNGKNVYGYIMNKNFEN